jgi:hypothetical protein
MRKINGSDPFFRAAAVVVLMAFSSAATAGSVSAGPAAGAAIVGSTVVPATETILKVPARDRDGKRLAPGEAGAVTLQGEQLTTVRNHLTTAEGMTMDGAVIRVPTKLGDGSAATITLDTQSGVLLVVRH